MGALLDHQRPHRLAAPDNRAPFIFAAGGEQLRVKLGEVPRFRDRHPVITPEVADLAFDAAFFVRLVRRAELTAEAPVRAEGDEARGLLPLIAAQDLLHRRFQVVVPQDRKHALKIIERVFVSVEECLLGRAMIRAVESRAARHAPHRKHLQQHWRAAQFRPPFVPINLAFLSELVVLRHTGRTRRPAQLSFAFPHIQPHRHLSHFVLRHLGSDPFEDTMCRVTLLARCRAVGLQDRIDECTQWSDYRSLSLTLFPLRWLRIRQRLAHHPAMHPQLVRHPLNCPDTELVFSANLLEQLHLRSPLHRASPLISRMLRLVRVGQFKLSKWAKSEYRNQAVGPTQWLPSTYPYPLEITV